MNLVLFTAHYPFGNGEPFLEEELRLAESQFANITIITYARPNEQRTRYVPKNARVIMLRRNDSAFQQKFALAAAAFRLRVWKAILQGIRERGGRKAVMVIRRTLLSDRHVASIEKPFRTDEALRNLGADTIWYSYWMDASARFLAIHRNEMKGIKISRTHRFECFFDQGFVAGRKEMLAQLDGVFPISESGREDLLSHYGAAVPGLEQKLKTVRLGVSLPESVPVPNGTDRAFTIVSCSNVIPLKRLDLLIDALSLLSQTRVNWIHFGDGVQMDEILTRAARQLDGKDHVRYTFRGRVPKDEILQYYASEPVDLFVNCSDSEGVPVSAMEAMSYGIPVVARNVGGLCELVDDGCGRLLQEQITAKELADAIESVLLGLDGVPTASRRTAARAQIAQDYCAQKNHEVFFNEIKRMCETKWNSGS